MKTQKGSKSTDISYTEKNFNQTKISEEEYQKVKKQLLSILVTYYPQIKNKEKETEDIIHNLYELRCKNNFQTESGTSEAKSFQEEMKFRILENFIKILFFRPELITNLKLFLPSNISIENIPKFYRNRRFLDIFKKNSIEIENEKEKGEEKSTANNMQKTANEKEEEKIKYQNKIKEIIKEDNLEQLQKENNMNIILEDSFFEIENMNIPILHYCIIQKAMKCFKFLLLNGADPSKTLSYEEGPSWNKKQGNKYKWDCMTIAICFGEWEMMKILEERGINKLNNPNVWEAAALTHRNNLLKLFISNKDQINNFQECLNNGLLGASRGNNFKGIIVLLSKGADINAKGNIF